MNKIEELQQEREKICKHLEESKNNVAEMLKEIEFAIMFLETNPSVSDITWQIERIEKLLKRKDSAKYRTISKILKNLL